MRDLNATMFYKAKFNVTAKNPDECDLLWKLVMDIRGWITGKLNRYGHMIVEADMKRWTAFKMGGKLYDLEGGNRFFAESLHHGCKVKSLARSCRRYAGWANPV